MWIYGEGESEALNMEKVYSIKVRDFEEEGLVLIVASTLNDDDIVLRVCTTMSDARESLKAFVEVLNQ